MRVFLSHSTKDRDFVKKLAEEIRALNVDPWLCEVDIDHGDDFIQEIDKELSETDLVVLIWSPEAAASKWTQKERTFALKRHVEVGTFLTTVLLREHPLPPLQQTNIYFDCRTDLKKGKAELLTWLERQRDMRDITKRGNARLQKLDYEPESFTGREAFFETLHTELVAKAGRVLIWGAPGNGKTTLALKFAWRARGAFDTVIFQTCGDRPLATIANDLAPKIDSSWISDPHEIQIPKIKERLASIRSLLVLDDVWREDIKQLIPGPNASVLVTSRSRHAVSFPTKLFLSGFDTGEQRQYLTQNLSTEWTGSWLDQLQELAKKYDGSPLALSTIVQQLQETYAPHDEALRGLRFSSIEEMLRDFATRQPELSKRLLNAVAVCAPQGVWLPLAARIANMSPEEMAQARDQLVNNSLMRVANRDEQRYNLHTLLHKALAPDALRAGHAEAVLQVFKNRRNDWRSCQRCAEEIGAALDHWEGKDHKFYDLAFAAFAIFQKTGLLEAGFAVMKRYEAAAKAAQNRDQLQRSYGNQAIILQDWGRLGEAMALHMKVEAICFEISNRNDLQMSYGNQALILQVWGRVDEAMALHKKQEALCLELGEKEGLQMSYANQAGILKDWGRLDEAMTLLKKQEALGLELGNRESLQRSYNNQAIILMDQNRLDEALDLLMKQEALCLELGFRRDLAYGFWARGRVFKKMSRTAEARQKLNDALTIFTALNMPRERESVQKDLDSLDA